MQKKIKEAVMRWRDKREADTSLEFNHTYKRKGKSFKARITADDTGKAGIKLISSNGYNEKYVKYQLSHYFNLFNTSLQTSIASGDIILTFYANGNPPAVGSVVTLSAQTYYYAVNNGILDCNGNQLDRQWTATYLGSQEDTCSLGAEPVKYTKFKLQ